MESSSPNITARVSLDPQCPSHEDWTDVIPTIKGAQSLPHERTFPHHSLLTPTAYPPSNQLVKMLVGLSIQTLKSQATKKCPQNL